MEIVEEQKGVTRMEDFLFRMLHGLIVFVAYIIGLLIGYFGFGSFAAAVVCSFVGGVIGVLFIRRDSGDGVLPYGETLLEYFSNFIAVVIAVVVIIISGSMIASIIGFVVSTFFRAIKQSIEANSIESSSSVYSAAYKDAYNREAENEVRKRMGL